MDQRCPAITTYPLPRPMPRRRPHCCSGRLALSDKNKETAPNQGAVSPSSTELVLSLHNAQGTIDAGGSGDDDLGVTIVRIAPASSFEQAVRSCNFAQGHTAGQITARINHAAPELAHVYSLSAGLFAGNRTSAGA